MSVCVHYIEEETEKPLQRKKKYLLLLFSIWIQSPVPVFYLFGFWGVLKAVDCIGLSYLGHLLMNMEPRKISYICHT